MVHSDPTKRRKTSVTDIVDALVSKILRWIERIRMTMRPHILFVDDNPDICELVQLMLQAAGFRVSTTDKSADVLRLVTTTHFDALLLDYWMPETTGLELCRQVRMFDQSTPILICSGVVTKADREAADLAGAQGYVEKPFVFKDLILVLRSLTKDSGVNAESKSKSAK